MKKWIFLMFMISFNTQAMTPCFLYTMADSMLQESIDCNKPADDANYADRVAFQKKQEKLRIKNVGATFEKETMAICEDNCVIQDLFMDPADEEAYKVRAKICKMRFAQKINEHKKEVGSLAKSLNCKFDDSKLSKYIQVIDKFKSCHWANKMVIKPKASCITTSACVGVATCTAGEYKGLDLQINCEAKDNICPSVASCALSTNVDWIEVLDGERPSGNQSQTKSKAQAE